MMGREICGTVSRGTTPSPRLLQRSTSTPLLFELKGRTFESITKARILNKKFSLKRENENISDLSKKVNRMSVIQMLRQNLGFKHQSNFVWKSFDSSTSEEDSVDSETYGSLEYLRVLRGIKAEIFQ